MLDANIKTKKAIHPRGNKQFPRVAPRPVKRFPKLKLEVTIADSGTYCFGNEAPKRYSVYPFAELFLQV